MQRYNIVNVENVYTHSISKRIIAKLAVELYPTRGITWKTFEFDNMKEWEEAQEKGFIEGVFVESPWLMKDQ